MSSNNIPLRPGRRPGKSETRTQILESARRAFSQNGFARTTVRAIATEAQVDPALIHHYFGSKEQLFTAAIALPLDPKKVLAPVHSSTSDQLGTSLLTAVLGVWESEHQAAILAAFRSAISGEGTRLIQSFLLNIVLRDIIPRVDSPAGTGIIRAELVASQIAGLLVTRYILELEPLKSLSVDALVPLVAPNLQRYLTGELPI
ncbi:TetR/AcrR family transcriptional regulator [Rhodococcus sp. AD45-ID]|uniref:TetR family transcriptional regulator n=1 Tax=Nocardia globerula TaxID=1818 RepID=A0A652YZA7_NOCGL|nr:MULTISPECIES: TetR family transcriptional regulator [Rhodococcus]NMD58622.1 TetR/AcrR family transcriptional regulator [Nocardia globerula]KJF19603.1 transcriptional regulator BetI [Rhodococcus sp. AD45]MDV8066785.1 TetR family transcriptional regulator [Rhodococcus sp. IEGM 1366]NRI66432.1 TetR/AcrR family transcriptional regulator [Rhodococcus sp. MS16]PSR40794.1 TetR/AcrR family transcriptional regulator [Rhodococcus sp. AD45-ID]